MKKKLFSLLTLLLLVTVISAQYPRASIWTNDINTFKVQDNLNGASQNMVLFVGSSSFVKWTTLKTDFPESNVLNRAFGGSWMSDLIYYFNDVVKPYSPVQVVLYEGDNDLSDSSKTVNQFFEDVVTMTRLININFPNAKILIVSIKPSPSRESVFDKYKVANALMKDYADKISYIGYVDVWNPMLNTDGTPNASLFGNDMLHMNAAGYSLWQSILEPLLLKRLSVKNAK